MSTFGVKPRFEPRNPMRSARTVSRVIRMTLGGAAASALAPRQTTHTNWRIRDIGKKFITGKVCDLNSLCFDSLFNSLLAITSSHRQRLAFYSSRKKCLAHRSLTAAAKADIGNTLLSQR